MGDAELRKHFVPLAGKLREPEAYPLFLRERRRLLARAMTDLLEEYRPTHLTSATEVHAVPHGDEVLTVTLYSDFFDGTEGVLVFEARAGSAQTRVAVEYMQLIRFLSDLEAGLASDLPIGSDVVSGSPTAEEVQLPIGPLLVTGSLSEWTKVLDRELGEMRAKNQAPPTAVGAEEHYSNRLVFPILESE